jgi:hypothetical protein
MLAPSLLGLRHVFLALAADPPPPPQPGLEEDYDYPSADSIFAARGVRLLKGNGHLLLVECGGAGLVEVLSRSKGKVCFRVKGAKGLLTLELPETYLIKGDNHTLSVKVIVAGETQTVAVKPDEWVPVGEGTSPESAPATLLEIRASP